MIVSNALDAKLLAIRRVAMRGPCVSPPLQGGDLMELPSKISEDAHRLLSLPACLVSDPAPDDAQAAGPLVGSDDQRASLGRRCLSSFSGQTLPLLLLPWA